MKRESHEDLFPSLEGMIKAENSLLFEELWDAPKAVIALALMKFTKKNVLIISGGEREERLIDDLTYFSDHPVLDYPAWETLPGEEIKPGPDIMGKRFEILSDLLKSKKPQILLTSLQGALQKVCKKEVLKKSLLHWKKGDELPFDQLPKILSELGYRRESVAADKGEFAVRGGILDIFPLSGFDPYRIDFFGDEIDGIRTYDPISQRSTGKRNELLITPADETPFLTHGVNLLEYLGKESVILFDDLVAIEDRFVALKSLPKGNMLSLEEFLSDAASCKKVYFTKDRVEKLATVTGGKEDIAFEIFDQEIQTKRIPHPFIPIDPLFFEIWKDWHLTFISDSDAEERALKENMGKISPNMTFQRGYLSSGFAVPGQKFALIPHTELSKRTKVRRQKWRNTYHTPASEFHQLEKGDLVVHFHNGVGQFQGVEKQKNHLGDIEEFLLITYAKNSKLFVPLSQSHLVTRYIGTSEEMPRLNDLGTKKWHQAKVKAEKAIIGYANDLLQMQASRVATGGFAYAPDSEDMTLFDEEFPFVETDDQLRAIADIKKDMCGSEAMDRLICGDVGYGKTEVAMRAAFKAVVDGGKQVAVLVPTTVLAMQHYETFKVRMESFPITIGVASRFVKPKEQKATIEKVATGGVDIIIGTHRLISKDVTFKNLGLIIIDEEQRFGVRAKEHLKKIKVGVDCLTLSATPIPRTLYFSLLGARDMSVINTPPQDRLPIKTIIAEREPSLFKNALLRELTRDGQAYVIHNRVETIFSVAKEIEELLPNAKVAVVHGQMNPPAIDAIFHAFKQGETDILVATTIIESGIDIPNANTILIDRSHHYGMADLYQLRGRVGRWNRPAYAYFLVPKNRALPELPRKRLQALVETSGFGGGMKLAMRDLEIRGAGDLLGTQQSGNVSSIGFHFYCKLLKRAISTLKKEIAPTFYDTRLEFKTGASLPPSYIYETNLRMEIYHRLGETTTFEEVEELFKELIDRFGPLPEPAKWLYHQARLNIFASKNQFTLLKGDKRTLIAKRRHKDKVITQESFLPIYKSPGDFEIGITKILMREFGLPLA